MAIVTTKYNTNSNVGKFRQALHDAGFRHTAKEGGIYSDVRKKFSRLKLYFGSSVDEASKEMKVKLVSNLIDQFGDRLLFVDAAPGPWFMHGDEKSIVVKVKI